MNKVGVLERSPSLNPGDRSHVKPGGRSRGRTKRGRGKGQGGWLARALARAEGLIAVVDLQNRLVYASQAFLSTYGYTEAEVLGRDPSFFYSPKNPPGLCQSVFQRALEGSWKGEVLSCRKDGTELPITLSAQLIRDSDGEMRGIVSVAFDLSEAKRVEGAVLEAVEREQRRIGEDLHDGLCQRLFSIAVACSSVRGKLAARALPEAEELGWISRQVEGSIADAHNLARGLCLSHVSSEGLVAALGCLASETSEQGLISCFAKCSGDGAIRDQTLSTHLYRLAQEAVRNAVKHAKPKRIRIRLVLGSRSGRLSVIDDGIGISQASRPNSGMGLDLLRSRAGAIGGALRIQRIRRGGTLVSCRFPCGEPGQVEPKVEDGAT